MGFLPLSLRKERTIAIFDIGSGSVGGAITRIPKDPKGVPSILKGVRVEIPMRDEFDFNTALSDMTKALDDVAKELLNLKVAPVEEIVCVLASPWYLSETRMVKMSQPQSFVFTKRVADELLQKEVSSLSDEYKKKYGTLDDSPEAIEHHVVAVSLNGYPVDDPMGKHTKEVEMSVILSLSPKICLNKIRQTVEQHFHHVPIQFSSFVVASYIAVRDKYVTLDSYALMDIGGEMTDIAIVSKGILKTSLSFPFGKNTLFKHMSATRDMSMRDAKELFGLWSTNVLEKSRIEKAAPLFKSIEESWSQSLQQCVAALPHTLHFPGIVFLTADLEMQSFFSDIICNDSYIQSINGGTTCNVVTLEGPEFLTMCNYKEGFCDPFLMIEAIAVMRKKESHEKEY
jgi:hypothetical protein